MEEQCNKSSDQASLSTSKITINSYAKSRIEGEAFIPDHIFSYIISGSHEVWMGDRKYSFKQGDLRLFRKNQLCRYVKNSGSAGFKSIAVHIDKSILMEMATYYRLSANSEYTGEGSILLDSHPLLINYVDSLTAYTQNQNGDERIISLKVKELVLLLMNVAEPGKLDLKAFMNSHYRYNVNIDRFAYLTGRSLAAFKRDFTKLYHTSPGKWLTQKRLEEAYDLIEIQDQKPSEIYLDLGFEDFSHFSFAYKKAFGHSPTKNNKTYK
jgi:AraC-like DNA-binding protein